MIKWKVVGKYGVIGNGQVGNLRLPLFKVIYVLSIDTKHPDDVYELICYLPGMESNIRFPTYELAKLTAEEELKAWLNITGLTFK